MLNVLKLRNFKAWGSADLTFGKVTGLFGPNSAGKSSLLQFLLLLKQTRNATDRGIVLDFGGPADLASLGTFTDVVHRHDAQKKIDWNLNWTLPKELKIRSPGSGPGGSLLFSGRELSTWCEVGLRHGSLWSYRLAYEFDGVYFTLQSRDASPEDFVLSTNDNEKAFRFVRIQGRAWPLPHPVKTHLFPTQSRSYYQNAYFLGDFELAYENLMDSIYYLGPLREYPRREYHWSGSRPSDVGERGERTVDAILAATRDNVVRTLRPRAQRVSLMSFQEIIAHWLTELNIIHDFRLEEIAPGTNLYRALVRTTPSSVPTALPDVGFGVSQVLPALVLLYYVPEGSTVLMEQPEIHLHPAVQSGLADVMLNVARVRNIQIVVESHSEHLMRRLQRRVAEETVSSDDVKLYFVSAQNGHAELSNLDLNMWGEIENWPEHFFGDEMGEIAAIAEASLRRKIGHKQVG